MFERVLPEDRIMRVSLSRALGIVFFFVTQASFPQVDVRDADVDMYAADVLYDPAIPTPEQVLGHALGHEPVRHHKLVEYIMRAAELSDRLSAEVIGYTHERRPILFVVATSPENRARLDTIRAEHAALTEARDNQPISDGMPVVTWINYGVHGAESSGMDASLPFIYHLAARRIRWATASLGPRAYRASVQLAVCTHKPLLVRPESAMVVVDAAGTAGLDAQMA
jgi:hypothetical protein